MEETKNYFFQIKQSKFLFDLKVHAKNID